MGRRTPRGLKRRLWDEAPKAECVVCHWCRTPMTYQAATVDHEPPLSLGGSPEQAVLACLACNQRRGQETDRQIKAARRRGKKNGR